MSNLFWIIPAASAYLWSFKWTFKAFYDDFKSDWGLSYLLIGIPMSAACALIPAFSLIHWFGQRPQKTKLRADNASHTIAKIIAGERKEP